MNEPNYLLRAKLACGSVLEFRQEHEQGLFTVQLTMPPGIPIKDAVKIDNDQLTIRASVESLAGVLKMMKIMTGQDKKPGFWERIWNAE